MTSHKTFITSVQFNKMLIFNNPEQSGVIF